MGFSIRFCVRFCAAFVTSDGMVLFWVEKGVEGGGASGLLKYRGGRRGHNIFTLHP